MYSILLSKTFISTNMKYQKHYLRLKYKKLTRLVLKNIIAYNKVKWVSFKEDILNTTISRNIHLNICIALENFPISTSNIRNEFNCWKYLQKNNFFNQ